MSLLDAAAKRKQAEIANGGKHDGYTMVEAMRPDLRPGESITYVPDRYCVKCQQPRGIKKCSICGGETVLREDLGEITLPDLPPGAALDLPMSTTDQPPPGAPALPASTRLVLDDATPPPDPEIDQLLARDASVSDADRPKLGSMLTRAMQERAAAERAEAQVIEQAKERSRLLNLAAERQAEAEAKPPVPAFLRPAAATGASILELAGRSNGSPRASGRSSMQTTTRERVLDEGGREQQRTPGKGSRRKTVEDELLSLWEEAKIQKEHWVQFAAAYARSGMAPEEAADAADSLYMELIKREQLARR